MKRFIKLIAVVVASATMFGCSTTNTQPKADAGTTEATDANAMTTEATTIAPEGQSTEEMPAEAVDSDKKITIDIMQFKVEIQDALTEATKTYMQQHPNITVTLSTVGGGDDYGAALKTKMASGAEPTIFNVDGPQGVSDWASKLADISDTEAAKAANPDLQTVVTTADGKVVGVPYDLEGYGLVYNKEIFEKAGIDPASLTTFEELEKAVKLLDSKKEELGLDGVFAFPLKETWVTGLHLLNVYLAPEFKDPLTAFNAKKVDFTANEQLKKMFDLQNDYSVQPTISMDYSTQVEKNFSMGKVAMIQQGNWVYGSIAGIDQEFADNGIGMIAIPTVENGAKMPVLAASYWCVNSDAGADEIQAAKDFLDWLNTSEEGKDIVLTKFNFVPAYSGYDTTKIADPLSKAVFDYAAAQNTYTAIFSGYPANWGMGSFGAEVQNYAGGKQTWDDVIKNTKESWEKARQ